MTQDPLLINIDSVENIYHSLQGFVTFPGLHLDVSI